MNQKLSEPSTSKAEKGVTDKKTAFTTTVTLHKLETKIARFHCAFFAGKEYQIRLWSGQGLVDTSQLTTATYQINKILITCNYF
jgi:hypothetical protein